VRSPKIFLLTFGTSQKNKKSSFGDFGMNAYLGFIIFRSMWTVNCSLHSPLASLASFQGKT